MALGAITVSCTVLLARLCAPHRPGIWLASGLAVAALPAFAYLSASVTNDDMVTAVSSMTVLALAYWLTKRSAIWSWAAAAGVSLALLAKFNAIGLLVCY